VIVYTGGTFDLIHPGHIHLLSRCYEIAHENQMLPGEVVVALNTDEFVESYKGHRPVMPYEDRAAVLRAIWCVDRVIPNTGGADSKPAIESINPDVIVIGEDWLTRDYHAQMGFNQEWLDERGIHIEYVPLLAGRSSTRLRDTINGLVA
jgi:glycerol-3-phosphate cytidylyltransferase